VIRCGEIYLADLNRARMHNMAKIRPVLVFQNDFLNRALHETLYADVTVVPLTTRCRGGEYRVALQPRDALAQPSEIVCNAVCTIRADLLLMAEGALTRLNTEEMARVKAAVQAVFAC